MGFIWFLFGLGIGLLLAWFFLSARYRKDLAEREGAWGAKLRASHEETAETRAQLSAAEAAAEDSKAQEAAAISRAAAFEKELTANRGALEDARLLANERGDKLSAAKTEAESLRARLAGEASARAGLEEKLRAQPAATPDSPAEPGSDAEAPTLTLKRYPEGDAAAGAPDDLTRIKGIGAVLKGKLNGLGITTFQQIAGFTEEEIERINAVLDFPGRIEREKWVEQAREFMR